MKIRGNLVACFALLALPGTALAQDNNLSVGVTGGATVFDLPNIPTGVYSSGAGTFQTSVDGFGVGATLGVSGSVALGSVGDLDTFLGLSAFATFGQGSSSAVDTFTGPGVVIIPGYTTPDNATIELNTSSSGLDSSGRSEISHTNPQGGGELIDVNVPTTPGGVQNVYGVTVASGDNSFGYSAVATQNGVVDAAAAYGAVGATDGGIFIGAGDLTGLTVTTDVYRNVIYTGADITFALSGNASDNLVVQGFLGPSYRFLDQRATTGIAVNIPEAPGDLGGTVFPTYGMTRVEDLTSHYMGGIAGLSASSPIGDNMVFTAGGELGLYHTTDSLHGTESYYVEGGEPTTAPRTTVTNATAATGSANGVAWAAGFDGSLTMALAPNRQLTFGAGVDYLSRVATVTRSNNVVLSTNTYVPGSDDGAAIYNTPSSNLPILSFGDMWSFTGTVSFTGQF
jgi:hypothetical protein